jgi:hypothetical protein
LKFYLRSAAEFFGYIIISFGEGGNMNFDRKTVIAGLFGLVALVFSFSFILPAAVQANSNYASATGYSCDSCHVQGVAPNGASLNGFGQKYAQCGYQLNCALNQQPPQVVQQQAPQNYGYSGQSQGNYRPQGAPASFNHSFIWLVKLTDSTGKSGELIWTFRPNSNQVDVVWYVDGNYLEDVMTYEGYRNGVASFYSPRLQTRFSGTPTADGNHIYEGTVAGPDAGPTDRWTASIF